LKPLAQNVSKTGEKKGTKTAQLETANPTRISRFPVLLWSTAVMIGNKRAIVTSSFHFKSRLSQKQM